MTCWKCGKEINDGIECSECLNGGIAFDKKKFDVIEWDKIKSFDDLKMMFSMIGIYVAHDSPSYKKLKRWLKSQ